MTGELERLRALSEAATPGPWIRRWESLDVHHMSGDDALTAMTDIDFAVAACQFVRDLLARQGVGVGLDEAAASMSSALDWLRHRDIAAAEYDLVKALERIGPPPGTLELAAGRPCSKTSLDRGHGWDGRPTPEHGAGSRNRWNGYGTGLVR